MTARDGFVIGMSIGLASWFCLNLLPRFIVFPKAIPIIASYLFAFLVFVALALPIISLLRGKEVLGTTIGGGVFGFTAFYQVMYILASIFQGNLPCL
jgi:hypothetical protein